MRSLVGNYVRIRFDRMSFADMSCTESSVASLSDAKNHIL